MNMVFQNKKKNQIEKMCPCIGLPNSSTSNLTAEELAALREAERLQAEKDKQKNKSRNSAGNNSQITKVMRCVNNVRYAKGGTVSQAQYLAWLEKAQLLKNKNIMI